MRTSLSASGGGSTSKVEGSMLLGTVRCGGLCEGFRGGQGGSVEVKMEVGRFGERVGKKRFSFFVF